MIIFQGQNMKHRHSNKDCGSGKYGWINVIPILRVLCTVYWLQKKKDSNEKKNGYGLLNRKKRDLIKKRTPEVV